MRDLNVTDLYERLEHYIDLGDKVKFYLSNEYEIITDLEFKRKILIPPTKKIKYDSIKNQELVITIIDFRPDKYNDLEIEGITEDDFSVRLKLSQCKSLDIIV